MTKTKIIKSAVILIIGLATFFFYTKTKEETDSKNIDDPEKALIETKKALTLVSTQLNIGMKNVLYIQEYEFTKSKIFIAQ